AFHPSFTPLSWGDARDSPKPGCYARRLPRDSQMEKSAYRQSALDGLRGLAALSVFAVHIWIYQLPNTMTLRRDAGTTMLFELRVAFVMFFVLSGYLLYRTFARAAVGRGDHVSIRGYLLRRAARIVPAYYLALAGSLL